MKDTTMFQKLFVFIVFSLVVLYGLTLKSNAQKNSIPIAQSECWPAKQMLEFSDNIKGGETKYDIAEGIVYYRLKYKKMVAYVVVVDAECGKWKLEPIVANSRDETSDLAIQAGCFAAINAGYFNMSDGESASYIKVKNKLVCDPRKNKALTGNEKLKPFLPRIFNRSELRVYKKLEKGLETEIVSHNLPIPSKLRLLSSLQAGPRLLPKLNSEAEGFIRKTAQGKTVDSIGTKRKAARSAIGLTGRGDYVIVCVEGGRKKEFSKGTSLKTLAQFMKEIGCVSALNLDGGTSSTLVVKGTLDRFGFGPDSANRTKKGYSVIYSNKPERKVKSILAVVAR